MTIGGWIGLLIGLGFGGFIGALLGGVAVDQYWKKHIGDIENNIRNSYKVPYEIEPGKKYLFKEDYTKHD